MASTTSPGFSAEDAVREKMQGGQLNFLVIGRYNVGKSTLINTMFLRSEGSLAEESPDSMPCTDKVKCYSSSVLEGGQPLNIYDTPGLQDGNEIGRSYLTSIEKACSNYHLVIYCTKMKGPVSSSEIETLKAFAGAFKSDVWKHFIIALTFANEVEPPHEDDDEREYFERVLETKKDRLRDAFKDINQEKVYNEFISKRVYPVGSGRVIKLPTTDDWRVDFMRGCQEACREGEGGKILGYSSKSYSYMIGGVVIGCALGIGAAAGSHVLLSEIVGATAVTIAEVALCTSGGAIGGAIGDILGQPTENKLQKDEEEQKKK